MEKRNIINVGLGKYEVSKSPDILRAIVGACIAITLYDRENKIGALLHPFLPEPKDEEEGKTNPFKFVKTSIPEVLKIIEEKGGSTKHIEAKIFGGALLFPFIANEDVKNIGKKNYDTAIKTLTDLGIKLKGEDIGGSTGRVIDFNLEDGSVKVKVMGRVRSII